MTDQASVVRCHRAQLKETLEHLQEAGARRHECVVLWLATPSDRGLDVAEVFRPRQRAEADMFRIPPDSMQELRAVLRHRRLMVAAQVHSHPYQAFHSRADDEWAIIRHLDALSLVVPDFAAKTSVDTFFAHAKVFRFSHSARWDEVPANEISSVCLVTP